MLDKRGLAYAIIVHISVCPALFCAGQTLPDAFDLRAEGDYGLVGDIRLQTGGTCWTHGTMAAIESNLLTSGVWFDQGFADKPNLAEYHLDWFNGFNSNSNLDWPSAGGLPVHEGGDYLVAAAYLSRGLGAVYCEAANDDTERDLPWYRDPPLERSPDYRLFYVRDIEWRTMGDDLSGIDAIKTALMTDGAIGTCMCYSPAFFSSLVHYQPPYDSGLPNHSIAIVGWDDNMPTQAPQGKGAWLCRNSWGSSWGLDGYFWISYYDKWCCREPQMGAVSFRNVEPLKYDHVYYHDLHGWRQTMTNCNEAMNVFYGVRRSRLAAVSFYTAVDRVDYEVNVYESFDGDSPEDLLSTATGSIETKGFHTVDLDRQVDLFAGEDFCVSVRLSAGGQAYDATSYVPVLLGGLSQATSPQQEAATFGLTEMGKAQLAEGDKVLVVSASQPGQSYLHAKYGWSDLYDFDASANFCIKALAVDVDDIAGDFNGDGEVDGKDVDILAQAWLSDQSQDSYRRICDIQRPDLHRIDIGDFAVFARIWADSYRVPR